MSPVPLSPPGEPGPRAHALAGGPDSGTAEPADRPFAATVGRVRSATTSHAAGRPPAAAVDVLLAAGCAAVSTVDLVLTNRAQVTVPAVLAIVLMAAPILLRRRRPVLAFLSSLVLIFGVLSTSDIYTTIGIPAVICAYALAAAYGRRAAVAAALGTMPVVIVMLQGYSPHAVLGWDTARNLALVVLPLALGVAAHERRAHTQALVDRADAAERTREEEARRRVGEERLRIAREVHDVVAHAMVSINVQAGVGAHLLRRNPAEAETTLREIKKVSGEALGDLRSVLELLRPAEETGPVDAGSHDPSPLRPTPGLATIGGLGERAHAAGVDLHLDVDPDVATLPATTSAVGYRIVQEALTNVMRHAGPTSARVRVTRHPDCVHIEVEDEGGAPPTSLHGSGTGSGLRGMHERAAAIGGAVEAGPRPHGGWRVTAVLPLDPTAAAVSS